ncbi:hypothetical protein [Hornefia butyriciproducens]|jgi:hypothetical protein|uniref:hypothetical protein n=1 Tax=Hornefia butyriciproducens TaxID=2652293 RepID=UPI0023F519C0|nr:hypothetical protein [Hornefia butyriciproducens]MCI7326092.1 hypothetical protein [Clostridiales bacterium]MCI7679988.1 hypothetical protein [Clostridiales bacterium]MDD6298436.1 hypothetical protein [Hornefia butyriciproducens]MDD7019268.1 hypothetical protein [Hornefia butyriciproducens]MDY2991230.1 hypothetical protein [Hornefia butyriciproducens]
MTIFGGLMIFIGIQLFLLGSQIQRGNTRLLTASVRENIPEKEMVMFCRLFGNKILTLCFVTLGVGVVCLFLKQSTMLPPVFIIVMALYTAAREALLYRQYRKKQN